MQQKFSLLIGKIAEIDRCVRMQTSKNQSLLTKQPKLEIDYNDSNKLNFLLCTSFLYKFFKESGKILFETFKVQKAFKKKDSDVSSVINNTTLLRTYFFHTLDCSDSRDLQIEISCSQWFLEKCNNTLPQDENEWGLCLDFLLQEGIFVINLVIDVLRDWESNASVIKSVFDKTKSYKYPYDYDILIYEIINDIGRDKLDVVKFRNAHIGKWAKHLKSLQKGYDFKIEARKLIEKSLTEVVADLPPFTATDIMRDFGLKPGKDVGFKLQKAHEIFNANKKLSQVEIFKILKEV
jgi:hypothetical protein